jgi:hypothetical protein
VAMNSKNRAEINAGLLELALPHSREVDEFMRASLIGPRLI